MIKLFRNIRKNLIKEGKTTKYFKYAIGEVFLVVIGILIALQLNNLNEHKKNRSYEITMLKEVRDAIAIDFIYLNKTIPYLESVENSFYALGIIKNDVSQPTDSLLAHLENIREYGSVLNLNISAYEAIKSGGLDKISNLTIRNQLSKLYGVEIPFTQSWINEVLRTELYNKMELFSKLFIIKSIPKEGRIEQEMIIEDITIIYNSSDFDKLLQTSWPLEQTIRKLKLIHDEMVKLNENIDLEIKR